MATTLLSSICLLVGANNSAPVPGITIQASYFQLYTKDRSLCPPVRDNEVLFYLYTQANADNPKQLKINDEELFRNSEIDFKKPTKFFVHGFLESYTSDDAQQTKKAYLDKEDCNMILVDAKVLYAGINYLAAANNVQAVGKYVATFVDYLVSKGMPISSLELIGMSLGGQTVGIIGAHVKSGRVPKILAYDPAGPLFNGYPEDKRLDKSDADFVIVIHTNWLVNGYSSPCGHVDFWINNTPLSQPGCSISQVTRRKPGNIPEIVFCSHFFSWRTGKYALYHPTAFPARKCDSYKSYKKGACNENDLQYVGDKVKATASGNYYATVGKEIYS